MDKSAPGKDVCEEVTRESLIAISYTLPETSFASSENLNSTEKSVGVDDYDAEEKFRSELIAISNCESPDVKDQSVTPGELKGICNLHGQHPECSA